MAQKRARTIGWSLTMPDPTRVQRMSLITRSHPSAKASPTSPPAPPFPGVPAAERDQGAPRAAPRPSVPQLLDAEWIIGAELADHGPVVVHRSVLPDQCSACGRLRGHTLFEHQARVIKERLVEAGLVAQVELRGRTLALVRRGPSTAGGQCASTSLPGVRARALGDPGDPGRR